MAKIRVLTDADVEVLQGIVERERRRLTNPAQRPAVDFEREHQAPELYACRTPSDGVPELIGDEPGVAECAVYRILRDNAARPYLSPVQNLTRVVFNLSTEPVGGNRWVGISRDKFGSWLLGGGAGGLFPVPTETDETPGTGTGTADLDVFLGSCGLASLHTDDCLRATGPLGSVLLSPAAGTTTVWSSDGLLYYDGGAGLAEFWAEGGRLHFAVGGLELLDCGDGCFAGGPLTGHTIPDHYTGTGANPCGGRAFRVCLRCEPCPAAGTGTGGSEPADAPCQDNQFGTGTLAGAWSNQAGGAACITPTAAVAGDATNDVLHVSVGVAQGCEGSVTLDTACVGGQYAMTGPGGITAVCVAFSATPFVIVWDFTFPASTISGSAGSARLTITWTPP